MITARFAVALLALASVSGCVTTVNSKRVNADRTDRGIRYYLPAPFLLVTPKPDGLDVKKLMLPDLGSQYTLDIQAYMTSYKSDVTVSNGMLQKVMFDVDNTKVASDTIAVASDI